ncbi:hypothetical protein [Sorangium sp. So ce426]|uniref:hypothetical protein n=1 Tax=Sorangium sp. So ce426 TaxID=3133312 RepID=UPI003F5C7958
MTIQATASSATTAISPCAGAPRSLSRARRASSCTNSSSILVSRPISTMLFASPTSRPSRRIWRPRISTSGGEAASGGASGATGGAAGAMGTAIGRSVGARSTRAGAGAAHAQSDAASRTTGHQVG